MGPAYTDPVKLRNPLILAEVKLAPAFAHVVAFSITYEVVAVLCRRTFSGSVLLLGPGIGVVAVLTYAERLLAPYSTKSTISSVFIKMVLWAVKLLNQIAVLFTANMVARLTSTSVNAVEPAWAAVFLVYLLILVYCAGRTSGVIE